MWKKFWADLGADLKNAFIHHWLRVVGFLVAYLGPFVFFVIAYSTEGDSAKKPLVSLPIGLWLVIIPLLIVYWLKIRTDLAEKLGSMKAQNEMQAGKHYAMIVLAESLKWLMSVATCLVFYYVIKMCEDLLKQASDGVLVIVICEAVGGLFYVLDAVFTRAPTDTPITK